MRLKSINIDQRSTTFSKIEQKKCLNNISNSINKIGIMFDNIIQLENFILHGIYEELNALIGVREDRINIIKNKGNQVYLNEYFAPSVQKVEEKIIEMVASWNNAKDRLSVDEIRGTIEILKQVSLLLKKTGIENYESLELLNNLIDEFGHFQVAKVIFSDDIVERINVLTKLKLEISEIFNLSKNNKDFAKKRKKLTIDDL